MREKNVMKIQHRLLATLMGMADMGADLQISGTLKQSLSETASPEQLTKTALNHRPDYLSARKKLEAQARPGRYRPGRSFPGYFSDRCLWRAMGPESHRSTGETPGSKACPGS
ncbi:MAG: hypothetical protein COX19_08300 [Desulfobacterales bacterium CG23_combo_of_CG06-09_8_20_14_all_51_8]|nr:MAG: hypothetical protein COX19_08300 [Desulfobacterales bacterium CG23_combo_of_CG06-09_8_20_14_all_51_8]